MAHKGRPAKSARRWWVLPGMVGKSGFYWNTSDNQSSFKRLVRVYRKSGTNVWIEDQNGCHSTIEGTGYYIGPYHPNSIMAAAKKHPDYDMGQFSSNPPFGNFGNGVSDPIVKVLATVPDHNHSPAAHAKLVDVQQVVRDGFQASLDGCDYSLNPYKNDMDKDQGLYHAWFIGWMDAQDVIDEKELQYD